MRFVTDPKQARTVVMKDKTSYPVGVNGHVVITDAKHVAEMERGNKDYFSSAPGVFGGDHRACRCRRSPWPWERVCPRCGSTLDAE
jgi:hypothetical protein